MKTEITKTFHFEAAHSLQHLPITHQCHRIHGHSYTVLVGVTGDIQNNGWVQDYADISSIVMKLINRLDHQYLNDLFAFPTTAEHLAAWFWKQLVKDLPLLSRIEVRETATSNAILTKI